MHISLCNFGLCCLEPCGKSNLVDNIEGYQAGYYCALGMIAVGFVLSVFFYQKEQQEERPLPREGE